MSTIVLAIDTATPAVTAGIVRVEGVEVLAGRVRVDARAHAEQLTPNVLGALTDARLTVNDLNALVVGCGPGPFTGLRVGMATAAAYGHALGIPVHGVCSLDAIAHDAGALVGGGELLVATDARRKEVYWGRYAVRSGTTSRLTDPAVDRPADLPVELRSEPTAGRGPVLFPDLFPSPVAVLDVRAEALAEVAAARLAAGEDLPVEPLYLRRPDALTTAERVAR